MVNLACPLSEHSMLYTCLAALINIVAVSIGPIVITLSIAILIYKVLMEMSKIATVIQRSILSILTIIPPI